MGIPNKEIDYRNKLSVEEQEIIAEHNIYPNEAVITNVEWEALQKYIIDRAPEKIIIDSSRNTRNSLIDQFELNVFSLDNLFGSSVTALEFDHQTKTLWAANLDKQLFNIKNGNISQIEMNEVVVDFHFNKEGVATTNIGELFPSDKKMGSISLLKINQKQELLSNLRRPVHSEYHDLNEDGQYELIVAEYGHKVGGLYLYKKIKNKYTATPLLQLPGAIKFYVSDINNDGRKDITALFAQGDESIWQFIQTDRFEFEAQRILRFPPEYGTSDFIIIDYNKDGKMDIITAHGDNADYSYILKSFHGIRIYLNNVDRYEENFFYPIYGTTKVVADDFDGDGDIDIATSAFFPDFDNFLNESFVYLENMNSNQFKFDSQIFKSDTPIRSLCLEKADFDSDGDQDLLLGLFGVSPQPIPTHLKSIFDAAKYDLFVLSNNQQ